MSKKTEELVNMLEDVVNELDLSNLMVEKHGQEGTAPAELVRLVLEEKDKQIRMLKLGMKASWDMKDKYTAEAKRWINNLSEDLNVPVQHVAAIFESGLTFHESQSTALESKESFDDELLQALSDNIDLVQKVYEDNLERLDGVSTIEDSFKEGINVGFQVKSIELRASESKGKELEKENKRLKEGIEKIKKCANEHCNDFEKYNDFVYITAVELLKSKQ